MTLLPQLAPLPSLPQLGAVPQPSVPPTSGGFWGSSAGQFLQGMGQGILGGGGAVASAPIESGLLRAVMVVGG
ncbi:MAG: hypothetical protein KGL39_44435, partial [Patescibacteria group bacterium]|nr:hypothetical protein [Patescibacteria group bacterium]